MDSSVALTRVNHVATPEVDKLRLVLPQGALTGAAARFVQLET